MTSIVLHWRMRAIIARGFAQTCCPSRSEHRIYEAKVSASYRHKPCKVHLYQILQESPQEICRDAKQFVLIDKDIGLKVDQFVF